MSKTIRRIGVLTGGGDCPGLNAVIRAVTKTAIYRYGLRVIGIEDGFAGLVENRMGELSSVGASGILTQGGTILGSSNRATPAKYYVGENADGSARFEDATERCLDNIKANGLDALIVIGGDGTMSCSAPFVDAGINCIGVPKTIDNDIVGTDITFGFLSATATATDALDRLHTTAQSHQRVVVCEVMGRNAGWIALHAGIASGSDIILVPEIPYELDPICAFIDDRFRRARAFAIVACSEGAKPKGGEQSYFDDPTRPQAPRLMGAGAAVAEAIEARTGVETRTTVLGHVQRGGTPVSADRVLATQFGHYAVELLMRGAVGRMVTWKNGTLGDIDLRAAAEKQRTIEPDDPLMDAARALRTCFGDWG